MANSEKVKELSEFCYEISQTEHDVFFSYHPHIDSVSVVAYKGGWHKAVTGPINSLPVLEEYWRIDELSVRRTKKVIVELLDIEIPQSKKSWLKSIKTWLTKEDLEWLNKK